MRKLTYTLISDGTSDRAFLPILNWLLTDLKLNCEINYEWADLGRIANPPKFLADRVVKALELYPCDLLFIHRDAEKQSRQTRLNEINQALQSINMIDLSILSIVCVIPVKMLEAWLLFDESAIRKAAGNPNGKCKIILPSAKKIESEPNPKQTLCELLKDASELSKRNLKKFNEREAIHRLAHVIDDFSPLYNLSAFQVLKRDLLTTLNNQGWL